MVSKFNEMSKGILEEVAAGRMSANQAKIVLRSHATISFQLECSKAISNFEYTASDKERNRLLDGTYSSGRKIRRSH